MNATIKTTVQSGPTTPLKPPAAHSYLRTTWCIEVGAADATLLLKALGGRLNEEDAKAARELGNRLTIARASAAKQLSDQLQVHAQAAIKNP